MSPVYDATYYLLPVTSHNVSLQQIPLPGWQGHYLSSVLLVSDSGCTTESECVIELQIWNDSMQRGTSYLIRLKNGTASMLWLLLLMLTLSLYDQRNHLIPNSCTLFDRNWVDFKFSQVSRIAVPPIICRLSFDENLPEMSLISCPYTGI